MCHLNCREVEIAAFLKGFLASSPGTVRLTLAPPVICRANQAGEPYQGRCATVREILKGSNLY